MKWQPRHTRSNFCHIPFQRQGEQRSLGIFHAWVLELNALRSDVSLMKCSKWYRNHSTAALPEHSAHSSAGLVPAGGSGQINRFSFQRQRAVMRRQAPPAQPPPQSHIPPLHKHAHEATLLLTFHTLNCVREMPPDATLTFTPLPSRAIHLGGEHTGGFVSREDMEMPSRSRRKTHTILKINHSVKCPRTPFEILGVRGNDRLLGFILRR